MSWVCKVVLLLLFCVRVGCKDFEPVSDQPCFGQKPCLHTTAESRVSSGCMNNMWNGVWQDEGVAKKKKMKIMGKTMSMTPLGLSNRFISQGDITCDLADILLLSPGEEVNKRLTDANERHLLARLQGLRNKLWLSIGTSVDHRSTRLCEYIFGKMLYFRENDLYFDFCIFERLNFTMMYTFQDGFSTTMSSRNATQQILRFSNIQKTLRARGWKPDFLTMAGVEWDFKHWIDAKAEPDFKAIYPTIKMHIHAARKTWPILSGLFLRTQYVSDGKYTSNVANIQRYNNILRSFQNSDRRANSCKSIFILDMEKLMRHNGTQRSGWTDGLHPAPWITLQYVGLCTNALADLGELCLDVKQAGVREAVSDT